MTIFHLLAVPGKSVPVAPPQALFQVVPFSNSYRREIVAAFFEKVKQVFSSLKKYNN
jgi:hypothetical protein